MEITGLADPCLQFELDNRELSCPCRSSSLTTAAHFISTPVWPLWPRISTILRKLSSFLTVTLLRSASHQTTMALSESCNTMNHLVIPQRSTSLLKNHRPLSHYLRTL